MPADGLSSLLSARGASLLPAIDEAWRRTTRRWLPAVDLEVPGRSMTSMYRAYGLLFEPAYPAVDDDALVAICLASRLLATASFCTDALIDDDGSSAIARADLAIRGGALTFEAERVLRGVVAADSKFWDQLRSLWQRTASAILDEFPPDDDRPYAVASERGALHRAADRSALAQVVPLLLSELAGAAGPLHTLLVSVEHYYRGRQMIDDVTDWQDDLVAGRPSYLLLAAGAITTRGQPTESEGLSGRIQTARTLTLSIAARELQRALELARSTPATPWARLVTAVLRSCHELAEAHSPGAPAAMGA